MFQVKKVCKDKIFIGWLGNLFYGHILKTLGGTFWRHQKVQNRQKIQILAGNYCCNKVGGAVNWSLNFLWFCIAWRNGWGIGVWALQWSSLLVVTGSNMTLSFAASCTKTNLIFGRHRKLSFERRKGQLFVVALIFRV